MAGRSNIVIVDGPDRSGKTEISRALAGDIRASYCKNRTEISSIQHDQGYFRHVTTYGIPYMLSFLEQVPCDVVFDRHYPSEWVYSRVLGRETDIATLEDADKRFDRLGTRLIICVRDDYSHITDDVVPDLLDSATLARINSAYREFCDWTRCEHYLLNVDDEDLDRELREIKGFLLNWR